LDLEIELNRISQRHVSDGDAMTWFRNFSVADQRDVLRVLIYMVLQTRATPADVAHAIDEAELKHTLTPCVMLSRGALNVQLSKAIQLPESELGALFMLLIVLFRIADRRRQLQCGDNCKHWWHRNLGDNDVVDDVRQRYREGVL
jgi:hypothetical protein